MKKKIMTMAVAAIVGCSMVFTPSCIGSFTLTNRLLAWNQHVGNKFINELVFFAFWVLPVYEICGIADVLVLNSIEFWSGTNPALAQADRYIDGNDGRTYLIHQDESGYDITDISTGEKTRLQFNEADSSWSIVTDENTIELFSFIDDTHIALPDGMGGFTEAEISADGVFSYSGKVSARNFATR